MQSRTIAKRIGLPLAVVLLLCSLNLNVRASDAENMVGDPLLGCLGGSFVATGISLLQDDPDWIGNLRTGAGIGLLLGLAWGIVDGYVLSSHNEPALLNIKSGGLTWSAPQLITSPVSSYQMGWTISRQPTPMNPVVAPQSTPDFRLNALHMRF